MRPPGRHHVLGLVFVRPSVSPAFCPVREPDLGKHLFCPLRGRPDRHRRTCCCCCCCCTTLTYCAGLALLKYKFHPNCAYTYPTRAHFAYVSVCVRICVHESHFEASCRARLFGADYVSLSAVRPSVRPDGHASEHGRLRQLKPVSERV